MATTKSEQAIRKEVKMMIDHRLSDYFTISEEYDEFTGIAKKSVKSNLLFETPFYDKNLVLHGRDTLIGADDKKLVELSSVPAVCPEESIGLSNYVLGKPDAEGLIGEIDHSLINRPHDHEWYVDSQNGMSAEELYNKYIIPKRKEIIFDAEDYLSKLILEHAKKRAKVQCHLVELNNSDSDAAYYLMFSIETAAQSREFPDVKVYVVTSSGRRLSFDGVKASSIVQREEVPLDMKDSMARHIQKKYQLFISRWYNSSFDLYTFSDSFIAGLTKEQVDDILIPGTKMSVRFGEFDIRGELGPGATFASNAFKYLNGDYSTAEALNKDLMALSDLELEEMQYDSEKAVIESESSVKELNEQDKRDKLINLEKQVYDINFLEFENLRNILIDPLKISQIKAIDEYCVHNNMQSIVLQRIDSIRDKSDKDAVLKSIDAVQSLAIKYGKRNRLAIILYAIFWVAIGIWCAISIEEGLKLFGFLLFSGIGVYAFIKGKPGFFKFMVKDALLEGDSSNFYNEIKEVQNNLDDLEATATYSSLNGTQKTDSELSQILMKLEDVRNKRDNIMGWLSKE